MPSGQRVQCALLDLAVHPHAVAPQPARGGAFEMAGQLAVIGEQQQAFGVEIEPPDGDDAPQFLRQRLEHGRPALRVAMGGNAPLRLIIAPEPWRFGGG